MEVLYGEYTPKCYVEQVTADKRFLQNALILLTMRGVSIQCTNNSMGKKISTRVVATLPCEVMYSSVFTDIIHYLIASITTSGLVV